MFRVFKHYLPLSVSLLALLESMFFFALIHALYKTQPHILFLSDGPGIPDFGASVLLTTIWFLCFAALGLYNRDIFVDRRQFFARGSLAAVLTVLAMFVAMQIYGVTNVSYPRWYFAAATVAVVMQVGLVFTLRHGFMLATGLDLFKRRVLIVGDDDQANRLRGFFAGRGNRNLVLVEQVGRSASAFAASSAPGSPPPASFPNDVSPLLARAKALQVDEIVVAAADRRGFPAWDLLACRIRGIAVTDYLTFLERETGRVDLKAVRPTWMALADGFSQDFSHRFVKRAFDVVVSSLILLLTLPITLVVALLVKLSSPGPVLYRQVRIGQHGKPFGILKFRSMRDGAEQGRPTWATSDDDRVTPIGKFIRKCRVDEIPQVVNVLKGEMSFVGPRPERPFFVEQLADEIPLYGIRHNVKPGITGWAQINYPYGASVDDAREKLAYDLYYVKNASIFLDFIILLQTVRVVLMLIGSR